MTSQLNSNLVFLRVTPARKAAWLSLLLLLLLQSTNLWSQSASELKDKRQELLAEIEANNAALASTKRDKAATLERIATLQRQIRKRKELVETLEKEVAYTDESIARTTSVAAALKLDLDRLRREYSQLLKVAYRSRLKRSWLVFIFSADGFNDAFRRWQYLRQYNRYRRRQVQLLKDTQLMLENKLAQLEEKRAEKAELLSQQQSQQSKLGRERKDKNQLLDHIKSDETSILAKLEEQEKARESLNQAIEMAIREEMDKRRRAEPSARASAATTSNSSKAFAQQRGQLPWPSVGDVSRPFGKQAHPDLPNIQISNNGIDIASGKDAAVRVVYPGEVVSTQFIPGYRHTVLVQHGDYYTVYSNLEKLEVDKGQKVNVGTILGRTGNDGADLHFEIWKEKSRMDPSRWLSQR